MPNVCVGDAIFPSEVHCMPGAPDAQCLQGMLYSPVRFIEAPDAKCLQGMPYSLVKFTRCPIFAGDPDAITHKLSCQLVCCVLRILKSLK